MTDREPDRIEELEASLADARELLAERDKEYLIAMNRIDKLEMQVHQYNRRVGWPRYPLKGE